jgi:serine/threonine protein kinase
VIGKGSYGLVCSAIDNYTGEKVAIKKINNVFEHVSDATRILREIKLLRLLKHPGACTGAAWHCLSTTLSSMKR